MSVKIDDLIITISKDASYPEVGAIKALSGCFVALYCSPEVGIEPTEEVTGIILDINDFGIRLMLSIDGLYTNDGKIVEVAWDRVAHIYYP